MRPIFWAKAALKVAPYTFGVYLLHEQVEIRYLWPMWFGAGEIDGIGRLILGSVGAVLCVFIAGVLVDAARALIFSGISKVLTALHLTCWLEKIDSAMKE